MSGAVNQRVGKRFHVKDAVFASPLFPRPLNPDLILVGRPQGMEHESRDTIAKGVSNSILAYVGKKAGGGYDPFLFGVSMTPKEVGISASS